MISPMKQSLSPVHRDPVTTQGRAGRSYPPRQVWGGPAPWPHEPHMNLRVRSKLPGLSLDWTQTCPGCGCMTARRIALSVSGLPKMLQGILHETLERLPEVVIVEVGPADALVSDDADAVMPMLVDGQVERVLVIDQDGSGASLHNLREPVRRIEALSRAALLEALGLTEPDPLAGLPGFLAAEVRQDGRQARTPLRSNPFRPMAQKSVMAHCVTSFAGWPHGFWSAVDRHRFRRARLRTCTPLSRNWHDGRRPARFDRRVWRERQDFSL